METCLGYQHKRQATRPPTPDPDAIQPADWNDDHEIEGAIGELSELARSRTRFFFLTTMQKARLCLCPLSRAI
jgi:hypothetical protein